MPRLWKAEKDEDEEEELRAAAEAKKKQEAVAQSAAESARAAEARLRARTAKPKPSRKPPAGEGSEKKVLVEETPALDTYEAPARSFVRGRAHLCLRRNLWLDLLQSVHLRSQPCSRFGR